jgi:hypothetical protein
MFEKLLEYTYIKFRYSERTKFFLKKTELVCLFVLGLYRTQELLLPDSRSRICRSLYMPWLVMSRGLGERQSSFHFRCWSFKHLKSLNIIFCCCSWCSKTNCNLFLFSIAGKLQSIKELSSDWKMLTRIIQSFIGIDIFSHTLMGTNNWL